MKSQGRRQSTNIRDLRKAGQSSHAYVTAVLEPLKDDPDLMNVLNRKHMARGQQIADSVRASIPSSPIAYRKGDRF